MKVYFHAEDDSKALNVVTAHFSLHHISYSDAFHIF